MKTFLCILFSILLLSNLNAQFEYDIDFTAEELVLDFFNSGVLVDVSNVSFNGTPAADTVSFQLAYFTGGNSAGFNIDEGVVMTTGYSPQAFDPNAFGDSWLLETNMDDPDMLAISNGATINNCAIIEFDAVINADAVAFNYVFASNEYPGFTCSIFNDVFGLFISGPGISGPYSDNAENIATVPESDTPIAINTINSGFSSAPGNEPNCEEANPNWQDDTIYFVNNGNADSSDIVFPGYTVNLEAYKEIIFGEMYHFKFAICDVMDGALDSGVFLEAGSFEGRLLNTSSTSNLEQDALKVFPNPAGDHVQIDVNMAGDYYVMISNSEGKLLKEEHLNSELNASIDLSELEAGIYILKVRDGDGHTFTQKLIKR